MSIGKGGGEDVGGGATGVPRSIAGRWLAVLLLTVAAWLLSSLLGDATASDATGLAAVYVPVGVAVALLVRLPRQRSAVAVGVVVGAVVIAVVTGGDLDEAMWTGAVNAIEAVVVAAIMSGFRVEGFRELRDVGFFTLAVVIGGLLGAALGGLVLVALAGIPWSTTAQTWFAADVAGMVLTVPMLVTARLRVPSLRPMAGYLGIVVVAVLLSALAVQIGPAVGGFAVFLAWYALLLMALLVGIRFGVTAMGVVQIPVAVAAFAAVSDAPSGEWLVQQGIAAVLGVSLLVSAVAVRSEIARRERSESLARDMVQRSPIPTARVRVPVARPVDGGPRIEILETNPAWMDLLGIGTGDDLMRSVDPETAPALEAAAADSRHATGVEARVVARGTSRMLDIRLDGVSMTSEGAAAARELVLVAQDVTEQRAAERALIQQARSDGLTGLLNRAAFEEAVARRLATRDEGPCGLVFVDLDGFKAINDTRGHAAGDQVLREVAARLRSAIRPRDLAGRYGGDEFVVFAQVDREEDLTVLAERIERGIAEPIDLGGKPLMSRASVGIAGAMPGDTAEQLLDRADRAMYRIKPRRPEPMLEE